MRWIKDEVKICNSHKGQKCVQFDRTSHYPDVENSLCNEYRKLRRKGLKVKGWWFKTRAKQILCKKHPDAEFNFSMGGLIVSNDASILVFGSQPTKHSTLQLINNSLFESFIEKFDRCKVW